MTAITPAVSNALASDYQVNGSWLTNNTTNPTGKGPVSTGPSNAVSEAVNGTAPVDLNPSPFNWQGPELSESAPEYLQGSQFPHAGPWPSIPDAYNGKEAFGTLPDDGITPIGFYKVPPKVTGFAHNSQTHAGHDRHSQDVDTAGWEQYTPSGRSAIRQEWNQPGYLGVDYYWPTTQPTTAQNRVARGGNQNVGGVVASYGDLADSGGNLAYTPAQPPSTSTQQPESGGSSFPTWGF